MFNPDFSFNAVITKALMHIEAGCKVIDQFPVTPELLESLRESARLTSTHYSTAIEGNRLTQQEVIEVVQANRQIPQRERDEREVRNYYQALAKVDILAKKTDVTESDIQLLHGVVYQGVEKTSPYRDGQNAIREANTGGIVYLPPEAKDVHRLMADLVNRVNEETTNQQLPIPIIAAIAHYQFATIHPYYDGNGRTARLLTTLILHQNGYGLNGIYSLDEYYAKNLSDYYKALTVGHHNYYFGREAADITAFVEYFCIGMADAVESIKALAQANNQPKAGINLRALKPQQRKILSLFKKQEEVTSLDIARHLKVSHRAGRDLARKWVAGGFLVVLNESKKGRSYGLGD